MGLLLLTFLPLLLSAKLLFLLDPPVWPDEPVFFDMARNFVSTGILKASLYNGTNPIAVNTGYGYPPLYFAFLGVWTSLFGSSIEAVRSLSLVLGILSLVTFFFILKQLFNNPVVWYVGTAILSFDITFSRASRVGRMEILVLLFFLLSLYFSLLWQKQKKPFYLPLIGVLVGLAMLSHPVGVIAPAILISYIFFDKSNAKVKTLATILISAAAVLSLWLIPLKGDLSALLTTFYLHWQNKSAGPPAYYLLFTSSTSWFILLSLSLVIILAFVFIAYRTRYLKQVRVTILLGLIISSFVALMGREGTYMVMVQPFIVLCLVALLQSAIQAKSRALKIIAAGLVILFILANINIQFFNNDNLMLNSPERKSFIDARSSNYHELAKLISATLLSQKILYHQKTPTKIYMSVTPDPYFDLKEFPQFEFQEVLAPLFPLSNRQYKKILDDSDYVVYNWISDKFFDNYIKYNTAEKLIVSQSYGYFAIIIRLVPKEARI